MEFDIQRITINTDFIFTATKSGNVEVWSKERFTRVASIKMSLGGHSKITSLVSDVDGGMLYAGSSDGKIKVKSVIENKQNVFSQMMFLLFLHSHLL